MKFVPRVAINNIPALVQIMAWRRLGDKPLSEPMMDSLPTHICVARPQWVNLGFYSRTVHIILAMCKNCPWHNEFQWNIDCERWIVTFCKEFYAQHHHFTETLPLHGKTSSVSWIWPIRQLLALCDGNLGFHIFSLVAQRFHTCNCYVGHIETNLTGHSENSVRWTRSSFSVFFKQNFVDNMILFEHLIC